MTCPKCGYQATSDAAFCIQCGARLAASAAQAPETPAPEAEGQRHSATVLLSDLSGYTAMNEALDPEEVAEILDEVKERATHIIEAHGGMVNQFVGDQVSAVFGIPTSQDDDPRRAVSAALEVREAMLPLSTRYADRIGAAIQLHTVIQTGLVVAQSRDARDGLYSITGDGFDAARALLAHARDDQILIGRETASRVAAFFELEPLRDDDDDAFRVRHAKGVRSRFEAALARGLTPLTGRRYELDRLRAAYADTCAGHGHVIAVVGEPGVGKSRLIHEFRASVDPHEAFVFHGRCQSYGGVTPYLPFLQAFRDGVGIREDDTRDRIAERVVRVVRELDPALERYLPVYLHLLSVRSEELPIPPEMQEEALPQAIQESVVAMNQRLSLQRPVLLHLEDWHWADEASEATLVRFACEIAEHRILIVVDHRPHYPLRRGAFESEVVRLEPVTRSATRELVAHCLGASHAPDELAERIHERTGGNPLFVEEICAALAQQGALRREGARVELRGAPDELALPETVQAVVRSRIDRLEPAARDLLRLASVVGREIPARVLVRLAEVEGADADLAKCLDELERLELLQAVQLAREPGYRFKHATTQEVTYETLLHQRRTAVHRRVAETLESLHADRIDEHVEELARHYVQAGDDAKAVEFLARAARKSARSYALAQARQHYRAAIERLSPGDADPERARQRIDIVLRWAETCIYSPEPAQLEQLIWARTQAAAHADPARALRCTYWISWIHYALGDLNDAIAETEQAIEQVRPLGQDDLLGLLLCNLGQCFVMAREHVRARDLLLEGVAIRQRAAEKGGYSVGGTYAYSLAQLGLVEGDAGDFEQSQRWFAEALAIAGRIGRRSAESSILTARGMMESIRGDFEGALATALEYRVIAEHMSATYVHACSETLEGFARFHRGEVDAGLALMRRAVDALERCGAFLTMSWSRGCLAEALALVGEADAASDQADRALRRAAAGDRLGESFARRARALAAAKRAGATPDAARAAIAEARSHAERVGSRAERLGVELFAAEIDATLGEADPALARLSKLVPELAALGMTGYRHLAEARRDALTTSPS
jgi:class 3 adenylate cyclase/tetratricopeptide (TPR) repeat protein